MLFFSVYSNKLIGVFEVDLLNVTFSMHMLSSNDSETGPNFFPNSYRHRMLGAVDSALWRTPNEKKNMIIMLH